MVVVFLFGPPAVGKLTVARELSELTGLRLFHNHLTVDLVVSLFVFGTKPFIELREKIWLETLRLAAEEGQSFIFTFNPESTVPEDFVERACQLVENGGGRVAFVELTCPEPELESRIENADRAQFSKLHSVDLYRELRSEGAFQVEGLPKPDLQIDTSELGPGEAAVRIETFIQTAF